MNRRQCLTSSLLCFFLSFNAWAVNAPLRALVLSGKNNHDWQSTTPALKRVLEESGMFTVRVLDDPSQCDEQLLRDCDVIVSNWTNFPAKERA